MDHPDRPSAGRSWGELVRTPLLDRVGVQSLPPATTGGRSRAWVGNGKRPACRDRRAPWIVNTASPGGWPVSSWGPPPGASQLSLNGRRLTEQDWPHVGLTLSPSGWRVRERAGPALRGCLGGLISGPDPAMAAPLQALRGSHWRFSRSGPLPGHNAPKRSLNRSRAENRPPAAHPRVLPTPRPSRPCARPAARPRLPQTSGARRGAALPS